MTALIPPRQLQSARTPQYIRLPTRQQLRLTQVSHSTLRQLPQQRCHQRSIPARLVQHHPQHRKTSILTTQRHSSRQALPTNMIQQLPHHNPRLLTRCRGHHLHQIQHPSHQLGLFQSTPVSRLFDLQHVRISTVISSSQKTGRTQQLLRTHLVPRCCSHRLPTTTFPRSRPPR